jgi:hypothetical protein
MVQIADPGVLRILDWPIRVLINPAELRPHGRLTIGVHHDVNACLLEAFGKVTHEQLGSPVIYWRDCDERRRD